MREFLGEHWGLVVIVVAVILLAAAVTTGGREQQADKLAHAQFMVGHACIISIKDVTLNRDGCLDADEQVHWRIK